MSSPPAPQVSIVVLNFNGAVHLNACLRSLVNTDYSNYRVVVVDNASADDSWRSADAWGERVTLIRNARNLGWSGGNNVGIRYSLASGARYIALANNDIKVHPAWIAQAVAAAEADPDIGVIGFDVYDAAEDANAEAAFDGASRRWQPAPPAPAAHVGGMAMFVRSALFTELGPLDESFWAYGDENDFLRRTTLAGYRIATVNVPVWHFGSASFGRTSLRAALLQTENNIQLLLKYAGARQLVCAAIRHVARRCLPRRRSNPTTAVEQRLGGRSFPINAALLVVAVVRVAFKLPRIIGSRRLARRVAEAVRLRRAGHAR